MTRNLMLIFCLVCLSLGHSPNLWSQTEEQEKDRLREDPAAREEYWFMKHADEHGEISASALIDAKIQMDALRLNQTTRFRKGFQRTADDAGIGGWEWIGPGNIGGRIRSILIHPANPNTMWVGSVSGGLWRSDNGGSSWYPVNDFMVNLAITSIVIDPTNFSIMYVATGEAISGFSSTRAGGIRGAGIFKSTDGGATWFQLSSTASYIGVNRIAHHPTQTGTLLATVFDGNSSTVKITSDGGTKWVTTLVAPATDVKYYPGSSNQAIVGAAPGVFTSTDGGQSWMPQATGASNKLPMATGRCEVACAPSASQTYYVSMAINGGQIWRSVNGGITWTLQDSGHKYLGTQGSYANSIWVDPTDANTIVVGGLNLYRSRNGGPSLDQISKWECFPDCGVIHSAHADQHIIVSPPGFNGSTNKTVFVGDDGGIQFTTDIYAAGNGGFGDGWAYQYNNLGITQFYQGAVTSSGNLIVGGAQDNGQPRLVNQAGANNWTSLYSFGDGGFVAIDPTNTQRVYGEYPTLLIRRSDDGGGGYSDKINGLSDACNAGGNTPCTAALFVAPFILNPVNSNVLYAGGLSIWQSNNNADSWSSIRPPLGDGELCSAMSAVVPGNTPNLWLGYNLGRISVGTFWGGSWSWSDVGGGVLPSKFVTSIAIDPFNYNEAIVTFGGYDTNQVFITTDLGSTWKKIRGTGTFKIPAIQVNSVTYNPQNPDWIYLGTDLGVLASEDHGATWGTTPLYQQNEGPANVPVSHLFWQNSDYLYAATWGRGMYKTRILPNIYVDINNNQFQDGTAQFPYHQILDGVNAAGAGSKIVINPGDYPQAPFVISKRIRITAPSGGIVIH